MMRSLWIAKTGMEAQQTQLDNISHNLANVATNGYKRSHAVFEDLIYQNLRQSGANTTEQTVLPTGLQVGLGVRPVATARIYTQGNLQQTSNNLDLAIKGDGFFQIQMPDGTTAYTRDGSFKLSATGQVVTSNGALLQPPIAIPANVASISVGQDGTVSVENAGGGAQVIGQIQLARFVNPAGLQAAGQNLLKETPASGPAQIGQPGQLGTGQLMQGALEASNVNVVEEMVNMIETQRAYEINSKAISAVDGMLRFLNNNM